MPAHLREIYPPRCRCHSRATKELRDGHNTVIGYFCDRHDDEALRVQLAYEADIVPDID